MLRRRAAKQIRRYEKRFGDLSLIPAYRHDPNETMSLRDRLMIYLPRGMRVLECWTCHRPYMPDGQLSPTCSDACTRTRAEYFKHIHDNFYHNPRRMPPEVYDYIRAEERLKFCAHCDDPFVPTRSDRKYCAERCRKAAYKHRNPGWRCRECGSVCAGRQHYCSDRCYMRHHRNTKSFCMRCHITIKPGCEVHPNEQTRMPRTVVTPKRDYSAFCSARCRDMPGWSPMHKVCDACGEGYFPTQASNQQRQKYCSEACNERVKTQRKRDQKPERLCITCHAPLGQKQQKYCGACARTRDAEA